MRSSRVKRNSNEFMTFFKDWIIPILIAVLVANLVTKYVLFKVLIPSESMYPTLEKGDQLFATMIYNHDKIKRGDMIVFKFDQDGKDETLIKRVIGLPGDEVVVKPNGEVYVNNEELDEPYKVQGNTQPGYFQVPDGKYLFLGDNRNNSYDSRFWKDPYIDKSNIIAKARVRVYPFNRMKFFN